MSLTSEEKWDHSVENALRKTSIGFAVGLVPSLILARTTAARAATLLFCAGLGAGVAYGEARYLFDHDVTFDRRHFVSVELFQKKAE
jgi:inner membrane organizing system protein 1